MLRWLRRIAPWVLSIRGQQPAEPPRAPGATPPVPAPTSPAAEPAPSPSTALVDSQRRFLWLLIALALTITLFLIALAVGIDREIATGVAIAALVFWGIVLLWKVPRWQAESRPGLSDKERLDAENSARGTLGSLLGTATLLAGIFFAWQQLGSTNQTLHLSEQGQITERFTRAVDQLGSDDMVIRLGGIYGLERIARDSERDAGPVLDVLAAYVREWAPRRAPSPGTPASDPAPSGPPVDVQAVLDVIGRRPREWTSPRCIDLSNTSLAGALLQGANLTGLCLVGADLTGANLARADLSGSDLGTADLTAANLDDAQLRATTLVSAILSGANLSRADLSGARLVNAVLQGAILQEATVRNAFLNGGSLAGALLFDADFAGAELLDTDLNGAVLAGADLSEARSLTQEQIDAAVSADDHTRLPPGITPPPAATPAA